MRKVIHSLVLCLLVMGLLAGCAAPAAGPAATSEGAAAGEPAAASSDLGGTLKIMVWNNPATVTTFEQINEQFMAKYPGAIIDMSVDKTEDYWTTTMPTRLAAGDVDIFMLQGFPNQVQEYMRGAEKASWQTMAESGQFLDLTDEPFLENYDENAVMAAGAYEGQVFTVPTGLYGFTGMFYNKELFEQYGVAVPTTWDELVQACDTFKQNNIECMTSGGKDVWPLMVAGWGVQQALYPDSAKLLEDLWSGTATFNDEKALMAWERMQQMLTFMEPGVTGIDNTAAPGRFASGKVAMYPAGTWDAANIAAANPDLQFGYFPTPGSDDPEENKTLGGKFDASLSIAGNAPNKEAALKWLEMFSEPQNYSAYANAVGIIPTQPTAELTSAIGEELKPYLPNFHNHISVLFVNPKGLSKYVVGPFSAANFTPYGEFDDAQKLADQVQADWDLALQSAE
jgi:raffinose/stachyose/melibiose transport system substrate-binding protein